MTKFALISDLHGNIPVFSGDKKDTVLICPGDIHEVHRENGYKKIITELCSKFREVLMVPGNHEYYGSNIQSTHKKLGELDMEIENFHFMQNSALMIDDVLCIGSTLWTSLDNNNPMTVYDASTVMNDYKYIRHGPHNYGWKRKLTTNDTMMFHEVAKEYIKSVSVEQFEGIHPKNPAVLVLSHHAPSFRSVSPKYIGDKLNGAYCSNLDDYILDLKPDVWVHGHVHDNFDYMIGSTRVLCNPQGYLMHTGTCENKSFDPDFTFTL